MADFEKKLKGVRQDSYAKMGEKRPTRWASLVVPIHSDIICRVTLLAYSICDSYVYWGAC